MARMPERLDEEELADWRAGRQTRANEYSPRWVVALRLEKIQGH